MEGLNLRCKTPRRRKSVVTRCDAVKATRADERWSVDFIADQLQDGRKIRVLTIVDQHTREAMATEVRGSFHSINVKDAWTYLEKVSLDFSRPGKPTDNAFIESFNAQVRAECLNAHVFESLEDAKGIFFQAGTLPR